MGTPEFAATALRALIAAGHEIAAVYSQPPRPAGRGYGEKRSAVHELAAAAGLRVFTPVSMKPADEQARFAGLQAEVAVVAAYGLLLPPPVLAAPRLGCYNIHASLLPRWRGAAPIQRAIMAGDAETGVTIMKMDVGLDTGPMALVGRVAIGPQTTAGSLHDQLADAGAQLMVDALALLAAGELALTPQPAAGVTTARKIDKAGTRIDFARSAVDVRNHIHGLSPWPGAWCEVAVAGKRQRVKLLAAELAVGEGPPGVLLDDALTVACGAGALRLTLLQREGKSALDAAAFSRGTPLAAGAVLA